MPYPFQLPIPAGLSLFSHIRCDSHPSLILAASTRRNVLRIALKNLKRCDPSTRSASLSTVLNALQDYIPYIVALDDGLSGRSVSGEEVHLTLREEILVEWRPCLNASLPGRPQKRVKGKGLDFELCFVLSTLASTWSLMAREQLFMLHGEASLDHDQRITAIKIANQHLCRASAIHTFVANRSAESGVSEPVVDIKVETQAALAALALAESNLTVILKDDPYPAIVAQNRNKADNEWMYKAPSIPKIRARLYAHGAIAADELAGKASALLSNAVDEELCDYVKSLQRTSKAKARRFFGVDAELGGKMGDAIGWLQAALKELGLGADDEGKSRTKGFTRLKQNWKERREDKKIKKGEEWGMDAGQIEESRVIAMLHEKWSKTNNIINAQAITPSAALVAHMPSGRELSEIEEYWPPSLDPEALAGMRGPVNARDLAQVEAESNDDDDTDDEGVQMHAPGAYPDSIAPSRASTRYY